MHFRCQPKIRVLNKELDSFLDLNPARLKCLTIPISSQLRHRTLNLTILATKTSPARRTKTATKDSKTSSSSVPYLFPRLAA